MDTEQRSTAEKDLSSERAHLRKRGGVLKNGGTLALYHDFPRACDPGAGADPKGPYHDTFRLLRF